MIYIVNCKTGYCIQIMIFGGLGRGREGQSIIIRQPQPAEEIEPCYLLTHISRISMGKHGEGVWPLIIIIFFWWWGGGKLCHSLIFNIYSTFGSHFILFILWNYFPHNYLLNVHGNFRNCKLNHLVINASLR